MYAASLGRTSASTIWRTVVFAGAMLATPLAGCGGGTKKADTTATEQKADPAADKAAADKAAADKAAADKAAADKAAADQAAADKAAADKAAEDQAAADKAAEEQAKKRPRGGGGRPTGRGFVLA
jgi:membrane protein involved in colicin uptake